MKSNCCSGSIISGGQLSNLRRTSLQHQDQNEYHSSSPFIVYRSAKYDGPHARVIQILRGYAKFYLVAPVLQMASRCKGTFYQICGLLLLLVASPLWILIVLGLFLFRRLRVILIQRLYPHLVLLEDNISNTHPQHPSGMVNTVIWTKGRLDANTVKKRMTLAIAEGADLLRLLELRRVSKFGQIVWEPTANFSLESHIVEAAKTFHNFPIVDEPLKELYRTGSNKSILQKFVSSCVSSSLDSSQPPWKIHIVPYISRDDGVREKTCLVIKMHVALIRHPAVQRALRELFLASPAVASKSEDTKLSPEMKEYDYEANKLAFWTQLVRRVKEVWKSYKKGFQVWMNLRLKQLQYHSKTAVLTLILIDGRDALKRLLFNLETFLAILWRDVAYYSVDIFTKFQAWAAVPILILLSIVRSSQFRRLGIRGRANSKKLISWSDLIHGDLAEAICAKTGTESSENVILMACAYALDDYYLQNNIANPGKVGFTVRNASSVLNSSSVGKALYVPCDFKNSPQNVVQEIRNLEERLSSYPAWRLLSLLYTLRHSVNFLPSGLARKVQSWLIACYPFSFTHVDLRSSESSMDLAPICQLYGELVEDFTFWPQPPLSDSGISITLVQYTGKTRLFVMSPFQSLDTVLTHRCNQYLIKLAEDVGVDRSKIPYSRRNSPNSTSCSTPLPSYANVRDNFSLRSNLKRSETR